MGQSRLTADQLVAYYQKRSGLAYRATGATLPQLASMFVTEGNRYNVRGDIAFAQSIVETAWFNYPDYGMVRPYNNNFSGIGACDSCGNGFQFSSALAGVRAQLQLLRNYADSSSSTSTIPDPPVPELWGSNPSTAAYNFDHYFAKGKAPLWNNMGNGNWATARQLRDGRARRLQPDAHRQRPARTVPARRPAVRSAHRRRSVPGEPAPARSCDRHDAVRRFVRR